MFAQRRDYLLHCMCFLQHHVPICAIMLTLLSSSHDFPSCRKRTPFSESVSGIALHRRSLRSRLGFGPQIRSGVRQLHWCGLSNSTRIGPLHIGRIQRDGRCVRSWCSKTTKATMCSTCALPLWLGRAHYGVHCSGSGQRQARGTTTTAHVHFLHRCILGVVRTSLRVVTVERLVSRP